MLLGYYLVWDFISCGYVERYKIPLCYRDCAVPYLRYFHTGYGIFYCDSMRHKVTLHWITMKYALAPYENVSGTVLRNLCIISNQTSATLMGVTDWYKCISLHKQPFTLHFTTSRSWIFCNHSIVESIRHIQHLVASVLCKEYSIRSVLQSALLCHCVVNLCCNEGQSYAACLRANDFYE